MRIFVALTTCLAALAAVTSTAASPGAKLTASDRAQISRALDVFVNHAVKRQDPAAAYRVVTGDLRAGTTRKDWETGSIPVYPYPARGHTFAWTVRYVTRDEAGLELMLMPRRGSKQGPIIFQVYLTPAKGRWLVNSFMPVATLAPLTAKKTKVRALNDFMPQVRGDGRAGGSGRVSQVYAIVPFAVVGLLLLGLAAWGVTARLRSRRVTRGLNHELPPLPPRLLRR